MSQPTAQRSSRHRSERHGRSTDTNEESPEQRAEDIDESELVRTDDGDLIHEETGLVVEEDNIDHGPEWRAFDQSERDQKSRVGAPTTPAMHDKGLTTEIGWRDKDANGHNLSNEKRKQMNRLRTWQQRIRTNDAGERNLQFALSEIDRMVSALGAPDNVQEMASVIYRRALDEDLIRGRSIEGVATGALHAAMRCEAIPRTLEEVSDVARVDHNRVGRAYRHLSQELGLEVSPAEPSQYVPRYCSALGVSSLVEQKATEIVADTTEEGLHAGKSPSGFAASAVYLASMLCGEKETQADVADVADVTEVTIRTRYQEQMEALGLVG
ncbi:transcription initiation factor TFIIB [Halogranum rubrum]|uniref:Transcription initiation factor IIB n=1 Tax=Halogranum rubrum TaxID=553466 RepID=A0A1I4BQY6_9EURY|nr:transcription initiation factor TFIIB [Halogranum rubrum]